MKAGPERDLLERYLSRSRAILRRAGIVALDTSETDESRAASPEARKREEGAALMAMRDRADTVVVLDERGTPMTSAAFASKLGRARDAGVPAFVLVVGGPDGIDAGTRDGASCVMSFGAATMPHQIVRVLVAEQVYRALTILTGHPYHRA